MTEKEKEQTWKIRKPDRLSSYFRVEKRPLILITLSGIIYNIGMVAGPYFEGQLVQRLFDIMNKKKTLQDMIRLAMLYLIVILFVQGMRCIKRFYVRRFANDTNRNMRHMIYNSLVYKSKTELDDTSTGSMMTKAISDVDACAEGMRKFTTEVFDTGVVLVAYLVMLFYYDWRLTLLSCCFTPIAYLAAEKMKKIVCRFNSDYKKSAGKLNDATMDRVSSAITYRVFGREENQDNRYEEQLADYEKKAVWANMWENTLQPVYHMISMTGVIFIVVFGAQNLNGTGWTVWNIAAFTTFLSCFAKMALKSSKAAKLFNAVQKAKVSWMRIKPLMQEYIEQEDATASKTGSRLEMKQVGFCYEDGLEWIKNLTFTADPGEVIGVTGPVASGKSTFGKLFLCEEAYQGSILIGTEELSEMSEADRSMKIAYLGHDPELMSATIQENIAFGSQESIEKVLQTVQLTEEVKAMDKGVDTYIGNRGERLSGGQQARLALARVIYQNSSIWILDDPFSAVDKKTEQQIMSDIRMLAKDKIVFIISHRLSLFPDFDQIIWLNRGEQEVSTHERLMKENESYRHLYVTQQTGGDLDEA